MVGNTFTFHQVLKTETSTYDCECRYQMYIVQGILVEVHTSVVYVYNYSLVTVQSQSCYYRMSNFNNCLLF